MSREARVQQFVDAAGGVTFQSVWACLAEEFVELHEAAENLHVVLEGDSDEAKAKYRAAFVKEWADCQYVLSQVACYYNIDGDEAFKRVADNNMTKLVDGKIVRREDGKILKPEGYTKPDMMGL